MADLYVRSSDGDNTDNGSTWGLAKATLVGAAAIDAAGDNIYLSSAHAESTASALTFALAGTLASPTTILSVNDAAAPPTATLAGATITTTGNSGMTFTGAGIYCEGVTFNCGSGVVNAALLASSTTTDARTHFKNCSFRLLGTGNSARIQVCSGVDGVTRWENCTVRFAAAAQAIAMFARGRFIWAGGGVLSGGAAASVLFSASGAAARGVVEGVDLSELSSSANLVAGGGVGSAGAVLFRNCRLPASWSGSLVTGTLGAGERHEMHNCDSADTNYRLLIEDYAGSIRTETTIVRSGGASDGTTPFSWRMASSANAKYPLIPLLSPELPARWNSTVGSAITVTVEVITDGFTLKDDECWLDVQYLGTSGAPLALFASDVKANLLATAANQTTSTETWTTTGLASPTKQKLSVTFTPQEAGYLQPLVKLAKASTTIYVCPKIAVT